MEARPTAETIRPTDAEALKLADRLMRGSRHAALGVIDAETGFPAVSRTLVATDFDGVPAILVSALSQHTAALAGDGRTSLLFGEPGKGDPLAHPRLTLTGRAEKIADGEQRARLRRRFLARHPKAALYIDFPDFGLFRIVPVAASLNGGFGKAYRFTAENLTIATSAHEALSAIEERAVAHMNEDHADAIAAYAAAFAGQKSGNWRMTGYDAGGFEIADGDRLVRIGFETPLQSADALRGMLAAMAKQARQMVEPSA